MYDEKKIAQLALDVQDAVNPRAVAGTFVKIIEALKDKDTEAICTHPAVQLFASKIHDMTRMGLSDTEAFRKAYDACQARASNDSLVVMEDACR